MNSKLIGVATLFTASTVFAGGAPTLGARTLEIGSTSTTATAGCGGKEGDKAKDASCGKGSCGAKDAKKDGSCGKDKKKDGSCGKDKKKDGSCGKDKKKEAPAEPKK